MRLKISLVEINQKEDGLIFAWIETKISVINRRFSRFRALCVVSEAVGTEELEEKIARLSA